MFGYLILIMVLRPRGLLGEETREAGSRRALERAAGTAARVAAGDRPDAPAMVATGARGRPDRVRDRAAVLLHGVERVHERDDHRGRLRGDVARPEHRRRLRRPARPRLRRLLRARRLLARLVRLGLLLQGQGARARARDRGDRDRDPPQLPADPDRGRDRLRARGNADRAADAAAARRLHRDRDARVRRDHRRGRGQRHRHPPRRRA